MESLRAEIILSPYMHDGGEYRFIRFAHAPDVIEVQQWNDDPDYDPNNEGWYHRDWVYTSHKKALRTLDEVAGEWLVNNTAASPSKEG